ncbi:MAG: cytochrome c biogenesis protein CcsA [Desulfobacterales bacterium]|nr:cytochrome c biogenesis protein CcsA [Desulfobacterales bacterium]MCP4162221.1 cytochrome c biogenesis protein CcsA [Deltaproteobacteria bacterium]
MEYLKTICVLTYILSSVSYILFLFVQKERYSKIGYYLLCLSFVMHSTVIFIGFHETGHIPAYNLRGAIMIASWSISLVYIVLKFRYELKILGTLSVPLACILFLIATQLPATEQFINPSYKSIWVFIHITAMFAGEGAFALACCCALLFLIQEHAIKNKMHGFFFKRLPSLELLDSTCNTCINVGFAIITLGFITGLVFAKMTWGQFISMDPKEILSAITWLTYAVLIHGRLTMGWKGRKSAIMAIIGFLLIIFTFIGVNFLFNGHHGEFTRF